MSVTLSIWAKETKTSNGQHDHDVPYPRAYNQAKDFLKEMLCNELELAARAETTASKNPLMSGLSPAEIIDGFRRQLLAFAQHEWPFVGFISDNNTLAWWESLEHHPQARVLAVSLSCHRDAYHLNSHADVGHQNLFDIGEFHA
jgi:hypothetical protein